MNIVKTTSAPSAPGIYCGLSNEAYHAGPGASKSSLDQLAKSPLHYFDAYLSNNPAPRYETAAMLFGTAAHTAILEPEDFAKWVVMPKVDGRTKEGKAAKEEAEAKAAASGGRIISADDHALIRAMGDAVSKHPASSLLANGHAELSVYWKDEDTGVLCRCRPDWLAGTGDVVDLKTTDNASPEAFTRSAYGWRYWVQAAFYMDGLAANGIDVGAFYFLAVEKSRPHAVMAYGATQELLEAGRREYKRLLLLLSDCHASGKWPGYGNYAPLDLPPYAKEARLSFDDANAADVEVM